MASYKDLVRMMQEGLPAAEIIRQMDVRPSRLKAMLNGKRFQERLKLERQLSAMTAFHARARSVREMHHRLMDIAASASDETARKAVTALLDDALECVAAELTAPMRKDLPPWMYLRKIDQMQVEPQLPPGCNGVKNMPPGKTKTPRTTRTS